MRCRRHDVEMPVGAITGISWCPECEDEIDRRIFTGMMEDLLRLNAERSPAYQEAARERVSIPVSMRPQTDTKRRKWLPKVRPFRTLLRALRRCKAFCETRRDARA